MSNVVYASQKFLKKNSATILTCAGAIGAVATTVMAVKATPKALELIEHAKEEKGEELTPVEVVAATAKVYIPAALVGVSSLACIFGANILNKKQQAGMASAYALLDNSYKNYKLKVGELYGEDADKHVKSEIAKDNYKKAEVSAPREGKKLYYDDFSQRYFQATSEEVLRAEYELNKLMSAEYGVYLNEFYDLLGIDTVDYGNYLGWSSYELVETYWASWIEFQHTKVVMDDGLECTIIYMSMEPTFDFENY